jgi:hypothetical protein
MKFKKLYKVLGYGPIPIMSRVSITGSNLSCDI